MNSAATATKGLLCSRWASRTDRVSSYERAFTQTLLAGHGEALAFGRGRVALWAILKAIGVDADSEVIFPAYTCETVPMAVKFAGAQCVYADTAARSYNVSVQDVAPLVTKRTKAIICQHTYGIRQPVQDWVRLAVDKGVFLIEDRCQLSDNDKVTDDGAVSSDAAYFSMHFSKPFSTTQGGMAVFRDQSVRAIADSIREHFTRDGDKRRARSLAFQTLLYTIAVRPTTRAIAGRLYRWAQRAGLIRGSISADEYGTTMPADYLMRAVNLQAALGMTQLERWERTRAHREQLTAFYLDRLKNLGIDVAALNPNSDRQALLMVPVLVENKEQLLRKAMGKALPVGTWFDRAPAHVNGRSAAVYDYTPGECPHTERLISREIHLLTGPQINRKQAEKAIGFLERYAHLANPSKAPSRPEVQEANARQVEIATSTDS